MLRLLAYYCYFSLFRRFIVVKKRIDRNKKDIARGDEYEVETSLDLVGAGDVTDVTLTHTVTKNGDLFHETISRWFGLSSVGVAAIESAMAKNVPKGKHGIKGFKALIKYWRTITKALGHLNDAGDAMPGVD